MYELYTQATNIVYVVLTLCCRLSLLPWWFGGCDDVLRRGLWVRTARETCCFQYCQMSLDAVGHPGTLIHKIYETKKNTDYFNREFTEFKIIMLQAE